MRASMSIPCLMLLSACGEKTDSGKTNDTALTADSGDTGHAHTGDTGDGEQTVVALTATGNTSLQAASNCLVQTVAAGHDTDVDWAALTVSVDGTPLDPALDVGEVRLVLYGQLSSADVCQGMRDDSFTQADVSGYVTFAPQAAETSCRLSEMTFLGFPLDPEAELVESAGTFLLAAYDHLSHALAWKIVAPEEGTATVPLDLSTDAVAITAAGGLGSTQVPGAEAYRADWSGLTTTALGGALDLSRVDRLELARFSEEPEALLAVLQAGNFIDLQRGAEAVYAVNVQGDGLDVGLSSAVDGGGSRFPGFDPGASWLISLTCGACGASVPSFLGLVSVE